MSVFTVNSSADTDDGSCDPLGQGTGNQDCTLREAINAANAHPNASTAETDRDQIGFAIPSNDPGFNGQWATITVQTNLPPITDPVVIDGETQPGYADHPLVEILYTGQSDVFSLVWLQTGQNTIRGLSIDGYLPANLRIQPASLPCDHCDDANLIEDNYLGLEPDGVPSQTLTDLSVSGSSDNIIRNNRIAAGISDLVSIGPLFNDHPADNLIEGNFIGTTPDGRSIPAGFQGTGIGLQQTVGTHIGGVDGGAGRACTGSCNLIAGTFAATSSSGDTNELIEGNYLGTDITGTKDLTGGGVYAVGVTGLQIERNLISGGIGLDNGSTGSSDVTISGNYIGTDVSGTKLLAGSNSNDIGIAVDDPLSGQVTIGGGALGSSCSYSCNLIAGKLVGVGLGFNGDLGLKDENTLLQGNFIGTDVDGNHVAALGNGIGVDIASSENMIEENLIYSGGVMVAGNANTIERNVIAYSPKAAVSIFSDAGWLPPCCSGNLIRSNQIFANGFGIDLEEPGSCNGVQCGGGPTLNDPGDSDGIADGANELQNFPVITSAVSGGGETTITYSLNSHPSTPYTLEFFANDACNSSGYGEGQTVIGSKDITTDANGNYSSTDSFPTPLGAGPVVTATATDPANNTSEFSACLTAEPGGTIVVKKQTVPAGSSQSFAFTASYNSSGFSLSDGQSNTSGALAPGSYSVREAPVAGWDSSATCSDGSPVTNIEVSAGETVTCTFTNTQAAPGPRGVIAPTQTTCQSYVAGTAPTLGQVTYPVSGNKIGQGINPGVFFYYSRITTTRANQTVAVSESNTSTNGAALFGILNGQAWLYPLNCSSHAVGSTIGTNGSGASFTVKAPGTYVIGIKYDTKTIAGTKTPNPSTVTYNFTTSLGTSTSASVLLVRK